MIPNAVGRIDAITDAIRAGDREKTKSLLLAESDRLAENRRIAEAEVMRIKGMHDEVAIFASKMAHDHNWIIAQEECGRRDA